MTVCSLFKMSNAYNQASVDVGGVSPPEQHSPGVENIPPPGGPVVQGATPAPPQPILLLPPQGDLVPQMRYGIRANNRGRFHPEPPIMFAVGNQSGIPLQDAMEERYEGLVGRDEGMFVGCDSTAISFRIQV